MQNLEQIAKNAKSASIRLASLSSEVKNTALEAVAGILEANKEIIYQENLKDLEEAKIMLEKGEISDATYGRLKLDENKMRDMIQGICDVVKLEDPVNKKVFGRELAEGLELYKVTCPIGVIGVIFEARPDVIAQISSLAIKSANAVLLKGGKEAQNTNIIIAKLINEALEKIDNFPKNVINLLLTREDVAEMLKMDEYLDLIIPRGSNSLVKYIQSNTKIPVLGHASGICHIYVSETADFDKAIRICIDAKCQYPSACNAVETILINKKILPEFLLKLVSALNDNGVKIKGDEACREISQNIEEAGEIDWRTEYGDKTVSIKSVNNLEEAINHINTYGSGHTDSIITESEGDSEVFMNLVDSANVYKNASTRFSDGFRYGFGAEVGISTNKTHARGPVGLDGLTIYKYKLFGNGDIVEDFCTGKRKFEHKEIADTAKG